MLDTRNHSPVQRQFDAGFLAVEADLRDKVRDAKIGDSERVVFFRILDYARGATLTADHVGRCEDVSRSWAHEADLLSRNGASWAADEAIEVAVLYEVFAQALAPYAKASGL